MYQSTVFHNNKTQAVRLPKAVAFDDNVKKVSVLVRGNARIIMPSESVWDDWFDSPELQASDDFMASRDQPDEQVREAL